MVVGILLVLLEPFRTMLAILLELLEAFSKPALHALHALRNVCEESKSLSWQRTDRRYHVVER